MKKQLPADLMESIKQAGEIVRGSRVPSREFFVEATTIYAERKRASPKCEAQKNPH